VNHWRKRRRKRKRRRRRVYRRGTQCVPLLFLQ